MKRSVFRSRGNGFDSRREGSGPNGQFPKPEVFYDPLSSVTHNNFSRQENELGTNKYKTVLLKDYEGKYGHVGQLYEGGVWVFGRMDTEHTTIHGTWLNMISKFRQSKAPGFFTIKSLERLVLENKFQVKGEHRESQLKTELHSRNHPKTWQRDYNLSVVILIPETPEIREYIQENVNGL